jgi:hypothetical protein
MSKNKSPNSTNDMKRKISALINDSRELKKALKIFDWDNPPSKKSDKKPASVQ